MMNSVRLYLSEAQAQQLEAVAVQTHRTRSLLATAIIQTWLKAPVKPELPGPPAVDGLNLARALLREKIVKAYARALERGLKRRFTRGQVLREFLDQVRRFHGQRLSGRTVYRWNKAYRVHGLAGLIDGRQNRLRMGFDRG